MPIYFSYPQTQDLVVGAAIVDSLEFPSRLLCARRSTPPALAGLWEFPGGKVEPGESAHEGLHREIMEELGVTVKIGVEVKNSESSAAKGWPLGHRMRMRVFFAELAHSAEAAGASEAAEPQALEDHDLLRWVRIADLLSAESLEWIPADIPIVEALQQRVSAATSSGTF